MYEKKTLAAPLKMPLIPNGVKGDQLLSRRSVLRAEERTASDSPGVNKRRSIAHDKQNDGNVQAGHELVDSGALLDSNDQ